MRKGKKKGGGGEAVDSLRNFIHSFIHSLLSLRLSIESVMLDKVQTELCKEHESVIHKLYRNCVKRDRTLICVIYYVTCIWKACNSITQPSFEIYVLFISATPWRLVISEKKARQSWKSRGMLK